MNNEINKKEYKILTPFKGWVLENFPFIEADFDAITNYELMCKVTEYLNNVIYNQNQVQDLSDELVQGYNDLLEYVNNYFENLDVQDEINNKLDLLVENGTLEDLLSNYINNEVEQQNTKINMINNKVDSLASGSPAGVYATASALSTADPDHTKIYLVTADGKWYYYSTDDTSWVAGGTYQSTGIADNSVKSSNIHNVEYDKVSTTLIDNSLYTVSVWNGGGNIIDNGDGSYTLNKTETKQNGIQVILNKDGGANNNNDILFTFELKNYNGLKAPNVYRSYPSVTNIRIANIGENYLLVDKQYNSGSGNNTQALIVAYSELTNITIDNIKIYKGEQLQQFLAKNLKYSLENYLSKQSYSKYLDYQELEFKKNISYEQWNSPTDYLLEDYNLTFGTNKNCGIQFTSRTDVDGTLNIEFDAVVPVTATIPNIYICNNAVSVFYKVIPFVNGHNSIQVDLTELAIYHELTAPYKIIIGGNSGANNQFQINNLKMFVSDIYSNPLYDENVEKTFKNVFNAINNDGLANQLVLTSPNGTKYQVYVDNNGQLYTHGAIINKALFIGNSLLVGFGTHGMASYDTSDDYYAYVNNYLTDINANYTASKISGVGVETATSTTTANNYITNSILPLMSDDTDLVIIQIGDNTANNSTAMSLYNTNVTSLITALRNINANVKILLVGVWYNASKMIPIMTQTAQDNNVILVNISSLNTTANQNHIGATYIDSNGVEQTITQAGVASHPSSVGMKKIADVICNYI